MAELGAGWGAGSSGRGEGGWGALALETRPGLLPVPAVGVESESTFPYWLWAPLPGGGVTLKNLEEEGGLHGGLAWRGLGDTLGMQARPQRLEGGHL